MSSIFGNNLSTNSLTGSSNGSSLFDTSKKPTVTFASNLNQAASPKQSLFNASTTKISFSNPQASANVNAPATNLFGSFSGPVNPSSVNGNLNNIPTGIATSQSAPQSTLPQSSLFPSSTTSNLFGGVSIFNDKSQSSNFASQSLPKLGQSHLWNAASSQNNREKSVAEQMQILAEKWSSNSPQCAFHCYFYNQVAPDSVPFYGPSPEDNVRLWEEALLKKPNPEAIPVLGKGFGAVGKRLELQHSALIVLQGKMREIFTSLTTIMQKHELEFATRIANARRRNFALNLRYLALAGKVQVLRNRGYSLDSGEEELKKYLNNLEKLASDPLVGGRLDEIWARMSALRVKSQMIQEESKRLGLRNGKSVPFSLDDDAMKQVTKLLQKYDKQLAHLKNELGNIESEFKDRINFEKLEMDTLGSRQR